MCKCGPKCINRVVQLGSKISLCLFKSSTGKGWGLKTRESLLKGQFISEYVGEIISFDTANKNYEISNTHYVFEMNFYPSKKPYSIDATNYGNATRFINHSCTPNCIVYPVWYDTIDKNFPKLAFFSLRTIEKNEELTIDYSGGSDNQGQNLFLEDCKCEAPNCRKNIYV